MSSLKLLPIAALVASAQAFAADQVVELNTLNATTTVAAPFSANDTLSVDTAVNSPASGAFTQSVTFAVGAGVTSLMGQAAWEVTTAAGPGPRVTGVNIDIVNATTNALVASDSFAGTLGGFAISTFPMTAISPGSYRMLISGTATAGRQVLLDASVSFVPEPGTYAMLLAGLGALGFMMRRRVG